MKEALEAGFSALNLPPSGIRSLLRYGELLLETNQVMNLTAITEPEEVASLHFLDSLELLTLMDFSGKSVADVGTGAGFPGLPLRIVEPSIHLTLLDALEKRVGFLQHVCDELHLEDVECLHARAEEFAKRKRESFDLITSRAVANLQVLCELCLPLVREGGWFLAMKSVECGEELSCAQNAIKVLGGGCPVIRDYTIPGTQIVHRVIMIQKMQKTPQKYPRIFAKIKKNPL